MKTKLTEQEIIRLMREEWNARVKELTEEVELVMNTKVNGEEKPLLTPGLKVRHKKTNLRYTVDSVGPRDVILKTPEGEQFIVNADELHHAYKLD